MKRGFFLTVFPTAFVVLSYIFCASAAQAAAAQSSTVIQLTVLNPVSTTTYYISVSKNGTGSGTVTSADGNIVCGSTCFENNIPDASSTVLTAVADPDSTFVGWIVGGDPTVCPGTGTCSVSTSTVITATFNLNVTPPPPTPPPSTPTQPITASPSGPSQFIFEDFTSETTNSSAIVNWYTSLASISNISWGVNSDGSSGSGSETAYSNTHSIELDNLAPDTGYVLTIRAVSQNGEVIYDTYSFRTLPLTNSIPLNVSDFSGQVSFGGNILLTWANPFEPDFSSVIITRGTRFYPRDPGEGYIVYQGTEEAVLDTDVVPGQEYYYTAFVVNTEGAHSSGTLLEYGLPIGTSTPPASTSIFGGGTGTSSENTNQSTNQTANESTNPALLSEINFIQNNKLIPEIDSSVSIEADLPVLIEIPANIVPQNTEETTITIGKGSPASESFMFEKLSDGSLQAFIPATLPTGSTPFTIDFLQLGSEIQLNGAFVAEGSPAPFIPQDILAYFYQTYISNNFLCTTLPVFLMICQFFAAVPIVFLGVMTFLRK